MTWLKLDDGFAEHDKIMPLTDKAFRLHVVGMLACARNLTDGFISDARFVSVSAVAKAARKHAAELEAVGVWQRLDDGWRIRDYLDYNPSAEKVREERHKTQERKRRWEERRAQNASQERVTNAVTDAVTNAVRNAAPTRPDPTRITKPVVDVSPSFLPSPATDGTEGRILNLNNILGDVA